MTRLDIYDFNLLQSLLHEEIERVKKGTSKNKDKILKSYDNTYKKLTNLKKEEL